MITPTTITDKVIIIGVPAAGKIAGGSVSLSLGVTSEVSSTVSPFKFV